MKHSLSHFINFKKTNEFMKKFGFLTLAVVSLLFTACDPKEETTDVIVLLEVAVVVEEVEVVNFGRPLLAMMITVILAF